MELNKVWNYGSVGSFFQKYYEKLLTENMIGGGELFIEDYKDEDGTPTPLSQFLFPIKKDKFTYLIPSQYINKLPVKVQFFERISYSGKGYRLAIKLKPMRITPNDTMSFRELVDNFANVKHDTPSMDLLWRLISIISFVDRINIRVATNPEFGKDSKLNIINSLTGEIGKISNPTIAKLEYLLFNKICFINEVAGINSQSKQDVEQFLLQCGDFNNEYVKRSRASTGSSEKYDISKMSLVIAYNDLAQYTNTNKYFDFMWTNAGAINNRILPFLFNGKIIENFNEVFDIDKVVKDNWDFYIKFLRALLYYRNTPITTMRYEQPKFIFDTDRWKRNFTIILKWVDLYSNTQEEFNELSTMLYKCHKNYLKMIGKETTSIDDSQSSLSITEETIDDNPITQAIKKSGKERVIDYLEMFDKGEGIGIDTLIKGTLVEDSLIGKMLQDGDIYEIKNGVVRLLN